MAQSEVELLRLQVQQLTKIRDDQASEILGLRMQVSELIPASDEPPLKGLKVAVIGPSFRRAEYEAIVRSLGAIPLVAASEEKHGKIHQVASKAHGIIHITTYGSHMVDDVVMPIARKTGVPLTNLTLRGLGSLKQTVLGMAEDMKIYAELKQFE